MPSDLNASGSGMLLDDEWGDAPVLGRRDEQSFFGRGVEDASLIRTELLHELFEAQADATPLGVAVVCGEKCLSYGEVEKAANRLARFLRSKGAGPGVCVGMLMPRGEAAYVVMLGILKSGAAYVPVDTQCPGDRAAFVFSDCGARIVVTCQALVDRVGGFAGEIVLVDEQAGEIERESSERIETRTLPNDLCYVIYTSGTTGRPKGVMVEHRSACHLVRAEGKIFGVQSGDRVFQGFSIAFDASVEEIWMAFFAGATLIVGTEEMVYSGAGLSKLLADAKVTVLSCIPTLLSMMSEDVPSVRLLIVGGEVCPSELARRWCRVGRRMLNTYGPTEGTVVATCGELAADRGVTIGRPLANYRCYILDERMRPVKVGEIGQLHIGGVGVARGYVGRPELTAERFVVDPFCSSHGRLYRTGDLGRWNEDGEIEFVGRADMQVKLRGYRIELSEIDAVLLQCPMVAAAASVVREDESGVGRIVAYLVPREGRAIDEEVIREEVRHLLPPHMIPSLLEPIDRLPMLSSGKVDRFSLPEPRVRGVVGKCEEVRTRWEEKILAVWGKLFAPVQVSLSDDFFMDLGGHSLTAAGMVSQLRMDGDFADIAVPDVYRLRTIRELAKEFEGRGQKKISITTTAMRGRSSVHRACGFAQLGGLYLVVGLFSLQWLVPLVVYGHATVSGWSILGAVAGSLGVLLALPPVFFFVSIAAKWIILGKVREGSYPLWGWYYFRWWLVQRILSVVPIDDLAGTPLLNIYYRLMGSRIGRNVFIASDCARSFDLFSVGDDSSIGVETTLLGYSIEGGRLKIGAVSIGKECCVGARSILGVGSCMEDGGRLEELSMLPSGGVIGKGEKWVGSPGRMVGRAVERGVGNRCGLGMEVMYAIGVLLLPMAYIVAIFSGLLLLNFLDRKFGGYWFVLGCPVAAVGFVVMLCLEIAAIKWVLLGRVKEGEYRVHGGFYFRKWFVDQLMDLSLDLLGPLYGTMYLIPWLRMLGAKIGRHAEVSTARSASPDLLEMGDGGFVADAVSLGAGRFDRGWMKLGRTRIGRRAFIGNSAVLSGDVTIGDGTLIGVLSVSSLDADRVGTSWLGSPAFLLPRRQESAAFAVTETFEPTGKLLAQRGIIEFLRVMLPATVGGMLTIALIGLLVVLRRHVGLAEVFLLFPFLYGGCGVLAAGMVVACKWILMGRYVPGEKPLWSPFVWRTELLTALHEHIADAFLVEMLAGTPFVCWFFRLMGAKIGKRVYMETTALTEFDLISIGDDAALNLDCTMQTHLFEDRVMKMSRIEVGAGCSVGAGSIVLYDSRMSAGSALGDLSLLMKGESLPAGTCWEGTPARRR
jgi:non-ribosomal peptide synthetase-like protein